LAIFYEKNYQRKHSMRHTGHPIKEKAIEEKTFLQQPYVQMWFLSKKGQFDS